ncbi:MAG: transaldolase, partial [Chloroflexota bacterium]
ARPQRLLWASTSTKNPAYPDTLYVEELIGPRTVNTMPPETIAAFLDHGQVRGVTLLEAPEEAEATLAALAQAKVKMKAVAEELEAA